MGRRARPHHSLGDVLGFEPCWESAPPRRRGRAAATALASTTFVGLLVAVLLAPPVSVVALSAGEVERRWESLPSTLPDQPLPTRSVILASDGTRIAQFYSENRVPVALAQVPQVMKDAVVAIEDSRFYDHHGVDLRGTGRAMANNLLGGSTQGGSTLTQQYVKNVLLNAAEGAQERAAVTSRSSYMRKLREARLAIEVEKNTTKDEILEGYLNIAYYGDGAYGVGTAAQRYFSKKVGDLTLAEAALLAGLVQNPTTFDPTENLEAAIERRNVVLSRMLNLGLIEDAEYAEASAARVRLKATRPQNGCTTSQVPFFCQWVKQQLEDDPAFGETQAQRNERLYRGGMTIRTSLDLSAQKSAQAAVDAALGRNNRVASAAVVVEPGTGRVVAMAVNRDFGTSEPGSFDKTEVLLPVTPSFQPGSNFKPITLAAALERGFDPATRLTAPGSYTPPGQAAPPGGFTNSTSGGTGTFDAATAIARSSNTWFVRLQSDVGVLNVASMAERLGLDIPRTGPRAITARDASLTLGSYEVSPVQLAGAYAAFAASGVHCTPLPIDAATGPDGRELDVPDRNCHQAIPAPVADTVANLMVGTISGRDPGRTGKEQAIGRPAAGKTGTTQGNAAVWFSGFTPQYATAVWVGDPRGGFRYPLRGFTAYGRYIDRAYGGLVAGPIWASTMRALHRGLRVETFPRPAQTVTTGMVVPDVRGLSVDAAYGALRQAGYEVVLAPRNAKKDDALPVDVVALQRPAAGSFLGPQSVVRLTLSAGSERDLVFGVKDPGRDDEGADEAGSLRLPGVTSAPGR